jgi:hypothetical protein
MQVFTGIKRPGVDQAPQAVADHRRVELAAAEWVHWFNHRHLYQYCGDIPPVEMDAYYALGCHQQVMTRLR